MKITEISNEQSFNVSPVLIATPWYKPTVGGVAEVADRLHKLLERSGVKTHLLVCDNINSQNSLITETDNNNIWRIHIPCYILYRINIKSIMATLYRGITNTFEILKYIRNHRIATVVLLFPIDYAWPFILIKHLTKIKIIASYHGNDLTRYESNSFMLRYIMRKILLSADAIIVCAKHLAVIAQKIAGPNILNIHLIPNCVESDHFLPPMEYMRSQDSPVSLIHVSNFNPKKRTKDIVQAFAMASLSSETRLVMVGYGPDHMKTCQLAESLGIAARVEFVGAQTDIRPYLWKADIFVLASDDEGAPLVLLEAMAAGLAWISTPWGAAEMLPPGECGLVIPAGSPEKMAAAMEELVGDPEKRKRMGRRGRERAEVDFNVTTYAQQHCRLIQNVQGGRKASPPCTPPFVVPRTLRRD